MLRLALPALRVLVQVRAKPATLLSFARPVIAREVKNFSAISSVPSYPKITDSLLSNPKVQFIASNLTPVRTVTKFSLQKGKRKSVKAVTRKFFRLHWGAWIRTKVGRTKKLWKKSPPRKRRLRQHVFCNATQSTLLDKMVTKFWKRPKYYVDDPYEPYHTREEFEITRRKPLHRN